MPDWVTHIGLTTTVLKPAVRKNDIPLLALGSILPDLTKIISIQFLDFSNSTPLFKDFVVWYFEPFHTPFMAIFSSLILAILIKGNIKRNFFLIYIPALVHLFLDSFQMHLSFYPLLLYPFSLKNINIALYHNSNIISLILPILSFPLLLYVMIINEGHIKFVIRKKIMLIIVSIIMLTIPFLTRNLFYKNNYNSLDFLNNPKKWDGKYVELGVSYVEKTDGQIITLNELGRKLKIHIPTDKMFLVKKGSFISIRGKYLKGIIYAEKVLYDPIKRKKYISLVGLIFLIFILFPITSFLK